jgi:hypothetical protein
VSDIFDFGELNKLSADLGRAAVEIVPKVRQAVEVTARHTKDDWRDLASERNRGRAKRYPKSISYDMQLGEDGSIGAEIGPKIGGQGSLGGLLEDAPGDVTNAPQHNDQKALRQNLADFERGILKATEGPL